MVGNCDQNTEPFFHLPNSDEVPNMYTAVLLAKLRFLTLTSSENMTRDKAPFPEATLALLRHRQVVWRWARDGKLIFSSVAQLFFPNVVRASDWAKIFRHWPSFRSASTSMNWSGTPADWLLVTWRSRKRKRRARKLLLPLQWRRTLSRKEST